MGFFDTIKKALGGEEPKPGETVSPSQLLREAGIDTSGLKFGFGNNRISVTGTVAGPDYGDRIREVLSSIDGIAGVDVDVAVAAPADTVSATPPGAESSSEPVAPAAPDAGEPRTYVVQSGDTLWKIAEEMYGNGSKYMKIFESNRDLLDDPDRIFPGQELKIPDLEG